VFVFFPTVLYHNFMFLWGVPLMVVYLGFLPGDAMQSVVLLSVRP